MILVQMTDFHLTENDRLAYGKVATGRMLEAAVAAIAGLDPQPDAVVATGDLVDLGTIGEYERVGEILAALPMPVFLMPGNHDNREALRAAFPDAAYLGTDGYIQYTADIGPLRLIALDTVVPGKHYGILSEESLDWLESRLAEAPETPTVIAMHHPPFATGIVHMDWMGLRKGADGLAEIVAANPQVERILCGHVHRAVQARFAGTIASIAPSTAHQVALDLTGDQTPGFHLEPPGIQLHVWPDDPAAGPQNLVTHTLPVGSFDGPHPFFSTDGKLIV